MTDDPGGVDANAKTGTLGVRIGLGWAKSHSFHTGQCPVLKYNRQLMQAILYDKVQIAKASQRNYHFAGCGAEGATRISDQGAAKKFIIDPHGMAAKAAA